MQNLRNILAKGYRIVCSQGSAIHSIQQISGNSMQVELQDGIIEARIIQVINND